MYIAARLAPSGVPAGSTHTASVCHYGGVRLCTARSCNRSKAFAKLLKVCRRPCKQHLVRCCPLDIADIM